MHFLKLHVLVLQKEIEDFLGHFENAENATQKKQFNNNMKLQKKR